MNLGTHAFSPGVKTDFFSATVRLLYPAQRCPSVDSTLCDELKAYGELARIDTSLGALLGSILVTYFDVRAAQRLLVAIPGFAQTYPAADHDFRALQLNMTTFTEMANNVGGFAQFGEVANIQLQDANVVVEFYDMRAAQLLLTATGGTAVPWTPHQATQPAQLTYTPNLLTSDLYAPGAPLAAGGQPSLPGKHAAPPGLGGEETGSPRASPNAASTDGNTVSGATSVAGSPSKQVAERGNKPGRTKVTTKEFMKFDIHPEKISSGEDMRTTVMVRNLAGPNARHDFLKFLERAGLADKYIFFYMPCKEHRNIPAGFAFVNFMSPTDVLALNNMVNSGMWRECTTDSQSKPLALSYARFQGQEELIKHFSTSAVLHEQDPDKRPIFRTSAGELKEMSPIGSPATKPIKGERNVRELAASLIDACTPGEKDDSVTESPSYVVTPPSSSISPAKVDTSTPRKVSPQKGGNLAESLLGA